MPKLKIVVTGCDGAAGTNEAVTGIIARMGAPLERAGGRWRVVGYVENEFVDLVLSPGRNKIGIPTVIILLEALEKTGVKFCDIVADDSPTAYTSLIANLVALDLVGCKYKTTQ